MYGYRRCIVMNNSQKNKRIEIRVTEDEYNAYKYAAEKSKLSLSDWMRSRVKCGNNYSDTVVPQIIESLANLQTHLNKALQGIDTMNNIYYAYKESGNIWQCLKR